MDPQDWTASFTPAFDDLDTFLQMEVHKWTSGPPDTLDFVSLLQSP